MAAATVDALTRGGQFQTSTPQRDVKVGTSVTSLLWT